MVVVVVLALAAVVLMADRVAVSRAQRRIARRIEDRGLAAAPQVVIQGFPFLTQLAAGRLNEVVFSADGLRLGQVEVERLDLRLLGIRGGAGDGRKTAAELSGTALVGFAALARVTGIPGLSLSADGPDRVRITVGLGLVTGTATARVSPAGPRGIRIAVISAGGIPVALPGALRDITVPVPSLPAGMTIQRVGVTGQGVLVHVAGRNVSLGG